MEKFKDIRMANMLGGSSEGEPANSITFSVTQDCQLRCKYCYMVGKNKNNSMTFDVAKKAIDFVLSRRDIYSKNGVVWEFIGGEPFLEIELMDKICDYIKQQTYLLNHPWFENYTINISTNGLLYNTEKVQQFLEKNKNHISIGLSIDGNKEKHNKQRVYPNGKGSYDDVIKIIPLWIKQFPNSNIKSTFSHGDIQLLKDSVISLWDLGIKDVVANIVFEDVWDKDDPIIYEKQLKELADYVLDNDLASKVSTRFLEPNIGLPQNDQNCGFCGSGEMLSIDSKGNFYPCTRFIDFSLNNKKSLIIGNINDGINLDKLKAFKQISIKSISPEKCLNCNIASGCAACSGLNYDESEFDSVLERATHICEMHKANAKAAEYFWDKFSKKYNRESPRDYLKEISLWENPRYMQIITDSGVLPICNYSKRDNFKQEVMTEDLFNDSIIFAKENNFIPIIIGKENKDNYLRIDNTFNNISEEDILIHKNSKEIKDIANNNILLICKDDIDDLAKNFRKLTELKNNIRINIFISDLEKWSDNEVKRYEEELKKLVKHINDYNLKDVTLNIFDNNDKNRIDELEDCGAGKDLFTIAPSGKIYMCPAFYFNYPEYYIGDIYKGIDYKKIKAFNRQKNIFINNDEFENCCKCIYLNKLQTNEFSISSDILNRLTKIELEQSKKI